MNKIVAIILTLTFIGTFSGCKDKMVEPSIDCGQSSIGASHPKATALNEVLSNYIKKGIPGVALLVKDASGTWAGSAGLADISKGINMQPCHIGKVASITKIFMSTLAFTLVEEGKLDLDKKISEYLTSSQLKDIENADQVTIRQLLAHNTGIYDVITDNGFYLEVLNNPIKDWQADDLLKFVRNKPAAFASGQGPGYSNTNTLLLSLIIDKVGTTTHNYLLKEKIIQPLQLNDTYYYSSLNADNKLPEGKVAQGYYDLYNNGTIANLSNYNTGNGNGYTGLYSNVFDLYTFIDALYVQKTLLQQSSLDQMLTFDPKEETGKLLGVGAFKDFIHRAPDEYAWGHRGRDLAYSADLFYFPEKDQVMALVVNYGTDAESSLRPVFNEMRDAIVDVMMQP